MSDTCRIIGRCNVTRCSVRGNVLSQEYVISQDYVISQEYVVTDSCNVGDF